MNLVLRDRMDEYEAKLRDFDFTWRSDEQERDWHSSGWDSVAEKMRETEWRLLIEAEMIGSDAVMLLRKYQTGMA